MLRLQPCIVRRLRFQSRTGSPGHLAWGIGTAVFVNAIVSIPNGLPRPFSLYSSFKTDLLLNMFQSRTGSPGHLASACERYSACKGIVSIPNGLPRPFSLLIGRVRVASSDSVNP